MSTIINRVTHVCTDSYALFKNLNTTMSKQERLHFAIYSQNTFFCPIADSALVCSVSRLLASRQAPVMSRDRVVPPSLPNELLLQIISILQLSGDRKSQGALCRFLRVSRTCYSMAFRALYQCPYVTYDNCHRFNRSLDEFGHGSIVKRLHLPRFQNQNRVHLSIIEGCTDGLEEFVAVESL